MLGGFESYRIRNAYSSTDSCMMPSMRFLSSGEAQQKQSQSRPHSLVIVGFERDRRRIISKCHRRLIAKLDLGAQQPYQQIGSLIFVHLVQILRVRVGL